MTSPLSVNDHNLENYYVGNKMQSENGEKRGATECIDCLRKPNRRATSQIPDLKPK